MKARLAKNGRNGKREKQVGSDDDANTDGVDPDEPNAPKRVIRSGSFLCNASYFTGYRVSARMKTSPDSSTNRLAFRCVDPNP